MAAESNVHDIGSRYYDDTETEEKNLGLNNEQLWIRLEKVGKKISFAKDLLALGRYLTDPYVSWHRKAVVSAALVYLVSPVDKVRDMKPLFDILDELGVIEALLKYLGREIIPYYDPDYRT